MAQNKINTRLKDNPDTGFGTQTTVGGRFVNKDGSFNVKKRGLSYLKRISFYSYLLEFSWTKFFIFILLFFLLVNLAFTGLYWWNGMEELTGYYSNTYWGRVRELFYFSTQTFTTVGYGRINPVGDVADLIATAEAMCGWLFFALVTGLLYGRFVRPKAFVAFSQNALLSPYREGHALMFRMVPYKNIHHMTDVRVVVNVSFRIGAENLEYKFYQLTLERSRIDTLSMNWTVVHPINEESPLLNFTQTDFQTPDLDIEMLVQVTGFDPVFSNQVMARTSYTYEEMVWGAKFIPMYREEGDTTVLELNKLNVFDKVLLPKPKTAMSNTGNEQTPVSNR